MAETKRPDEILLRLEARHVELLERLDELDARVEQALTQFGRAAEKPDVAANATAAD